MEFEYENKIKVEFRDKLAAKEKEFFELKQKAENVIWTAKSNYEKEL